MNSLKVPLQRFATVWHTGALEPTRQDRPDQAPHEGHCISVSRCPVAWEQILSRADTRWELTDPSAEWLDVISMQSDRELMAEIHRWAEKVGYAVPERTYRVWRFDDAQEQWRDIYIPNADEARILAAIRAGFHEWEELEDAMRAEVTGLAPTGHEPCEEVVLYHLTETAKARIGGQGNAIADDMICMLWAEEVLKAHRPNLRGVWWRDHFEPDAMSAPRGGIFPSEVARFDAVDVTDQPFPYEEEMQSYIDVVTEPSWTPIDLAMVPTHARLSDLGLSGFLCEDEDNPAIPDSICRPDFYDYIKDVRSSLHEQEADRSTLRVIREGIETYATVEYESGVLLLHQNEDTEQTPEPGWLGYDNWVIVGFYDGPTVCVVPAHRGKGLGARLIEHCALARGCPPTFYVDEQMWSRDGLRSHAHAFDLIAARERRLQPLMRSPQPELGRLRA